MHRRNFLKSLGALVGAASLSPTIFIPKFDPVRWKMITPTGAGKIVPNPAYYEARYELVFMAGSYDAGLDGYGYWSRDLQEYPKPNPTEVTKLPIRYTLIDPVTFKPVPIPPYIKQ